MTPNSKSKKHAARPGDAIRAPEAERAKPHVPFLEADSADTTATREHGERGVAPREETLVGTSGSHTPGPDLRAEEPFGELPAGAATEGEGR